MANAVKPNTQFIGILIHAVSYNSDQEENGLGCAHITFTMLYYV